jgi:hypothetical protein
MIATPDYKQQFCTRSVKLLKKIISQTQSQTTAINFWYHLLNTGNFLIIILLNLEQVPQYDVDKQRSVVLAFAKVFETTRPDR